jgi:hypothetical protein
MKLYTNITNANDKGICTMKLSPASTVLTRQQFFAFTFLLSTLAGVIVIACAISFSSEVADFLSPTLSTMIIFVLFSMVLKWQIGDNLFGELGFLYLGLAVGYTVFPAFAFMFGGLDQAGPLVLLLPQPFELAIHLWRHTLFVFGVATGYLLTRGREKSQLITIKDPKGKDGLTIVFLIVLTAICILSLSLMSAPVETYIENYIRYDHLSWFARKFASVCIRLKLGMYSVFMTFLFINFKKYKLAIPIVVAIICTYELIYSLGARIDSLIIMLITVCLYNYFVKLITLKKGFMICITFVVIFSMVELFRSYEFDVNMIQTAVSEQGFKLASEFGAVYFTGFHLYTERANGILPPTEWPMFFSDFISVVTFGDFTRWNPMEWYARNYHPYSVVAPFTLGPIADSAIWGGEIDLILRGLINGAFFAYLVRWFLRFQDRWWGMAIYVYCYATCILTLKYSIFYHFTPLFKTMLPTLLMVAIIRKLTPSKQKFG